MKKLLKKILGSCLGFAMAIGVGAAVANNREFLPAKAESTAYVLGITEDDGNSAYANSKDASITSNKQTITWNIPGNQSLGNYVKLGGKLSSETTRSIYSKGIISQNISRIAVSTGAKDDAITVQSMTVTAHSTAANAASGDSPVSTFSFTYAASSNPSASKVGTTDLSGKYWRFNLSMTSSASKSNKGAIINSITFYYNDETPTYTITYDANGGSGTMSSTTGTNPAVTACTFTPPSGKQFSYWHTTSSGTGGTTYAVGDTPQKNLGLYAIWEDLPSGPSVSLTLTSDNPAYKGTAVTVSATSGNLSGTGLTWTVTEGTVNDISSDNTSFSGTLASTGTVTIKAQDNGGDTYDTVSLTVNAVTVKLNESATTVMQKRSIALTATVNTGSVTWGSNNANVTVTADSENPLIGNVTVAAGATIGSTATITATSTIDSSVHSGCVITVSENPFAIFTKLTNANQVSTNAVYALTNEEVYWLGTAIDSKQIASASTIDTIGYVKLEEATGGGYYLKFVVKNAMGSFNDASGKKYINNSSGTDLSASESGSSRWTASTDDDYGVMLQNSSNSDRFLGWNATAGSSTTAAKAYASSNLHTSYAPLYLYEVPQNKLDSLTISNQTTTFTAGTAFGLGNSAVLTAHYSLTGNTTDLLSGTLSYKINNVDVTTSTVLDHDTHNGKTVVVTYTDAVGGKISASGYTITVNYKPAESISLNLSSASLTLQKSVDLTATVTDQYANPNDVTWSSSVPGVVTLSKTSGDKTITVTGAAGGTTTITATANGYTATCTVTVDANPIVEIRDDADNIITDETLDHYTGDEVVYIQATSENIFPASFSWTNEDDDVITIVSDGYLCAVTIVGAGSSDVSVTCGGLTRTVTFSVTTSVVTSITLTSSVDSGELYDGTYSNTLTLTPEVTLVGNANSQIKWTSSDGDVATVSEEYTTAPTGITVTGVGAGSATITAQSVYTPSLSETFDVTVKADGVTTLSWTNRPKFNSSAAGFQRIWADDTTLGDLISQNSSYGIGTFTPTWKSGKSDTPTMGTGEHDVHIGIYDTAAPKVEGTPLTSSYVFTNDDNGKYVVAFYEGKASGYNTSLSITKWRSVIETEDVSSTITWSSASATVTGDASATVTNVQYTYYEDNSMRLGTGSGGGELKIETEADITSVVITAKAYNADRAGNLAIGDKALSVTNTTYKTFDELTLGTPTTELILSTASKNVRIVIQSIVIHCSGSQQIGKTDDCMGLESFINTNLHMNDYTTELGYCSDDEHHYYATAKAAFNLLNEHQRSLFVSNSAYALEYARLSAWAEANGDAFNNEDTLAPGSRITLFINIDNSNMASIIVIISMISIAAVGGYYFLRKRKED